MKHKHIEAAHEARMWLSQVIVPGIIGAIAIASNQQARMWIDEKVCNVKTKVQNLFHKS